MSLARKIFKNAMSNSAAFVIEAVVAFAMMPFVIHHLGDEAYGVWFLMNALTGYLGIFKTGFRPSINKHVAQYKALGEIDNMKQFMGASLHIFIYVSLLIAVTTLILSYFLPLFFSSQSFSIELFQVLLLLAGVQSIFSLMGTAYGGVVSGYQRYEVNSGIETLVILVRASLIVYFLPDFSNLYTMAIAHFSITTIGFMVTVYAARKIAPVKKLPIIKRPNKDVLRVILKYNSISFAVSGLAMLIGYLDSIVVGSLISLAVVTHYSVGSRLVSYCYNLLKVSTRVIAPAISELDATGKQDTLNLLLITTHKASCLFAYPILLMLLFQGDLFIQLWMGDGFSDSYEIMKILVLAAFLIAPTQSVNSYLYAIGKHKYLLYIMISEVIMSLPLAIYMEREFGALGIAIGFSIPRAVLRGFVLPFLLNHITQKNIFLAFLKNKIIILVACVPYIVMLLLAKYFQLAHNWMSFVFQAFFSGSIFMICVYFVALSNGEKQKLKSVFKSIIGRTFSGQDHYKLY